MVVFKKIILFFIIILFIQDLLLSQNQIIKKYFNNIMAGGKERIFSLSNDVKNITIYNANVKINLFENYSEVSVTYYLKNYGEDLDFFFAYPRLDAMIHKNIKDEKHIDKSETEEIVFQGEYQDFSLIIDKIPVKYEIVKSDLTELLPYKIGDQSISVKSLNEYEYQEEIDSFNYYYSWYVTPMQMKRKQKSIIKLSYITPHYYNIIKVNKDYTDLIVEDPALTYLSYNQDSEETYISDKLFLFLLKTSYSDQEKIIKKLSIQLTANIIDADYLKILPINYKKKGINYYWYYKNLHAKDLNNQIIKISPFYSYKTVNPYDFKILSDKQQSENQQYYAIDKSKNTIILQYLGNKPKLNIKGIRIFPICSKNKYGKYVFDQPFEIELSFSNDYIFSDPVIIRKKFSSRKITSEINKKSSLDILNSDGIEAKFIKIQFYFPSENPEMTKIADIQVLE